MVAAKLLEIEGVFFWNSKENTFSGMTGKFIKQLYSYGIDGCTNGWIGRWIYGQMQDYMDGQVNVCTDI